MKPRYIILMVLITVPFVWVLTLLGVDRLATPSFRAQFQEYAAAAPGIYILFVGVFIGLFVAELRAQSAARGRGRGPALPQGGGFESQYFRAMVLRCSDFDTSGMAGQEYILRQDEAFEPLSLVVAQQANPTGIRPAERDASIWQHLAIPQRRLLPRLWGRASTQRQFAILGSSGSGKTSLLRSVAIAFAQRQHTRIDPKMQMLTPLYLTLNEHREAIKRNPQIALSQLLVDAVRTRWELPQANLGFFQARLQSGKCIILLDGLDEIANEQDRREMTIWIREQLKRWPGNYLLLSSRPYGYYGNPLAGTVELEVQPFNPTQIEQFVRRWYLATERRSTNSDDTLIQRRARERADDLIQRLVRTADLEILATNPHLLTMIATVHRFQHKLPERRSELYKAICEVSLSDRRRPDDTQLTVIQKQRVLGPLAYAMMHRRRNDILKQEAIQIIAEPLAQVGSHVTPDEFLKRMMEVSGLLLEREVDTYGFAHLTYQEYLAAVHIQQQRQEAELNDAIDDVWWHETILLFAAQDDSSHILETCLQRVAHSERVLSLGITLVDEAISIRPDTKARFLGYLGEHVEYGDPSRRRLIAEALLRNSLRQMASLDEKKQRSIAKVQINHAAYQLFLDEQRLYKGHAYYPDHWNGQEFPSGQAREPVVGVRYSDAVAFCEWLSARDHEGWIYRLPNTEESKNYHVGMYGKPRYWTSDGAERFYGERWATPKEHTRALLAESLYADIAHLQILALSQMIEQIRVAVRDITGSSAVRGERLDLSSEQQIAREIAERGRLIDSLARAISFEARSVGESTSSMMSRLPAFARTVQDKAELAVARFEQARVAASSSASAWRRGDRERGVAEGDRTDQLRGEALSPLRMIGESLTGISSAIQQLIWMLPPVLRSSVQTLSHFQEVLDRAGLIAFHALSTSPKLIETSILAEVREHIYLLIGEKAVQEAGRAGVFPLDSGYASECARVFERTLATLPIQAPEERAYLRYWILLNGLIWLGRAGGPERGEGNRQQRERGLRLCRDLYLDLALLEQRVNGQMPAVEGIRLVRESRF